MASQNDSSFVSSIPQPNSKNVSPGKKGLQDMSASTANSRIQTMGPPPKGPERVSLMERAGQPAKPATALPSLRLPGSHFNATSLNGMPRAASLSSSVTSRSTSNASTRNVSASSSGSSVGSRSRPPSASSHRSQAALSNSRLQRSTYRGPASSLEPHHEEPPTGQVLGKRKGRLPLSSQFGPLLEELQPPKLRDGPLIPPLINRRPFTAMSLREISLPNGLSKLTLKDDPSESAPIVELKHLATPSSSIPRAVPSPAKSVHSSPSKSPKKKPSQAAFLNKDTNITSAFDIDQRFEDMENMQKQFEGQIKANVEAQQEMKASVSVYKSRIAELESIRDEFMSDNRRLKAELDVAKGRLESVTSAFEDQKRHQNNQIDDSNRQHRRELDDLRHETETERRRLIREHADALEDVQRVFESQLAAERAQHGRQIEMLNSEGAHSQQEIEKELETQMAILKTIEDDMERCKSDNAREQDMNNSLRDQLAAASQKEAELDKNVQRLEGHIQFLQSDNKSQSQAFADLEARMQRAIRDSEEAKEKLIKEETLRRKLHNQVQELKGNIRVFCRVRPALESDPVDTTARIAYPDEGTDAKELEVMGAEEKSSLGNITTKKHAFNFDRVFGPTSQNHDVFGEISQLVQSALDGYNVCIFCYGQTGSGKTFTMSAADGMIPLAINQIYSTAKSLEEKGWKYSMAGSFIEVYNENLNDLLGKAEEFDTKKHEIRHDMQKCKTEVTGIKTVELDSPGRVEEILRNAAKNRTVAATQANERSSRSHSIFILKLNGENGVTGERSEGTLNLVDLAGSERLSHSGATGDRLKETQNINKSLSCLGDVIGALGQGKEGGHVPYRNSKLTYLLQFSLGGNSKTLMFVMISPLQAHLSETLTSLKFGTKVHNTHIGTARKQTKMKD